MSGIISGAGSTSGIVGETSKSARYFYATKNNASNQGITADTFTLTTFDTIVQSHSSFSNSNDYFTATSADIGRWEFNATVSMFVNAGDMNNPVTSIYHNGANVIGGYKLVMSTTQTVRHYTIVTNGQLQIANGDTVKLYCYSSGTSPNIFGGDTIGIKGTSFEGKKL